MKDSVVRGRALQLLNERRGENFLPFGAAERAVPAPEGINNRDWLRALAQLAEYGLIDWKPIEDKSGMGLLGGFARINEFGTQILNRGAGTPIQISFDDSRQISVVGSPEVKMAAAVSLPQQAIGDALEELIDAIERANVSNKEKNEAKSLLRKLLESKAAASALGEGAQSLLAKYFAGG